MVDKDMNSAAIVILALSKRYIYIFLLIICLDQNQPKLHKQVTFCFDMGELNDNIMS